MWWQQGALVWWQQGPLVWGQRGPLVWGQQEDLGVWLCQKLIGAARWCGCRCKCRLACMRRERLAVS